MCLQCQNVYERVVKGLNYQSYQEQLMSLPLSILSTISFSILRRAVSVEWNRLYAECLKSDVYKYVHKGD